MDRPRQPSRQRSPHFVRAANHLLSPSWAEQATDSELNCLARATSRRQSHLRVVFRHQARRGKGQAVASSLPYKVFKESLRISPPPLLLLLAFFIRLLSSSELEVRHSLGPDKIESCEILKSVGGVYFTFAQLTCGSLPERLGSDLLDELAPDGVESCSRGSRLLLTQLAQA